MNIPIRPLDFAPIQYGVAVFYGIIVAWGAPCMARHFVGMAMCRFEPSQLKEGR